MAPVWALVEQLGRMGVKARLPPAPCKKKRHIGLRGVGHGLLHKGFPPEKVGKALTETNKNWLVYRDLFSGFFLQSLCNWLVTIIPSIH